MTSRFFISASGRLWLLLNRQVLGISLWGDSCGFTQSQQLNSTQILALTLTL